MTQPSADPTSSDEQMRRTTRRFALVAAIVAVTLIGGLVGVVIWAQNREPSAPAKAATTDFSSYEQSWSSAMAKAGVEATFPAGPVELAEVRTSGRREFSATFTAEEVAALAAVYRYAPSNLGTDVSFDGLEIAFPEPGRVDLDGTLYSGGSAYSVSASVPATYADGKIVFDASNAKLSVEGFGVGGGRRAQALGAFEDYLNALIDAAPGLSIDSAEIVDGSVAISGTAPQSLEHPPANEPSP
jgi:hypothetical protein